MLNLMQIDSETFDEFFEKIVNLYAEALIAAWGCSSDEAYGKAKEENSRILSDREKTNKHYQYWIIKDNQRIGYIWTGAIGPKEEAFIFAFEIEKTERGKGYGKETMTLIEEVLKKKGFKSIRLHVFEHSKSAIAVYEKTGYAPISRFMRKEIE